MSAAGHPPRCSDSALERADPRAGSAVPVRRWLLVEQPGPWGRDALTQSRLRGDVASRLAAGSRRTGTRVLLVRRHGRAGHAPQGRRHWAVADSRPGHEAIRWGRFEDEGELLDLGLDDLPADGPLPDVPDDGPTHDPARAAYLVCAHSRHDPCCAVRGRAVAAELDRLAPGQVWECSHVGGCRFAANTVVLPLGLYYGGLDAGSARALVEATAAGHVLPGLLRGRSGLPAAVQAAEHHAREQLAAGTRLDAFRPLASRPGPDGSVVVGLAEVATGREVEVTVVQVTTGPAALLTCAARAPSPPLGWRLRSLVERSAG